MEGICIHTHHKSYHCKASDPAAVPTHAPVSTSSFLIRPSSLFLSSLQDHLTPRPLVQGDFERIEDVPALTATWTTPTSYAPFGLERDGQQLDDC